MIIESLRKLKLVFGLVFLTLFFTSCAFKNPINGSNNFHYLVSKMVDESASKIKKKYSIR